MRRSRKDQAGYSWRIHELRKRLERLETRIDRRELVDRIHVLLDQAGVPVVAPPTRVK